MSHWFLQLGQRNWHCVALVLFITVTTGAWLVNPVDVQQGDFIPHLLTFGAIGGGLSGLVASWAWRYTARWEWVKALSMCLLAGILVGSSEWFLAGLFLALDRSAMDSARIFLGILLGCVNGSLMLWGLHRSVGPARVSRLSKSSHQPSRWSGPKSIQASSSQARRPQSRSESQMHVPSSASSSSPIPSSPLLSYPLPTPHQPDDTKQRLTLFRNLCALTSTEFEALVFTLNPPHGIVPSLPAAQGERASTLLQWLEGPTGPGLGQLRQILNDMGLRS